MSSRANLFVKSLKWYEWLLIAQSLVFYILIAISSRENFQFLAAYIAGLVLFALIIFAVFGVPAMYARKLRKNGRNGLSAFLIVATYLWVGLPVLLLMGILRLLAAIFSAMGDMDTSDSVFSVKKKCGRCGKPAPVSAQVGDVCAYCGARWGVVNTSYANSFTDKRCSNCGKPAPSEAKVGGFCSYCGAQWRTSVQK